MFGSGDRPRGLPAATDPSESFMLASLQSLTFGDCFNPTMDRRIYREDAGEADHSCEHLHAGRLQLSSGGDGFDTLKRNGLLDNRGESSTDNLLLGQYWRNCFPFHFRNIASIL